MARSAGPPSQPNVSAAETDRQPTRSGIKYAGFTEGSVGRHLVRLGSFMAMGSLSMNFARFAEAIYLGFVGTEALAAMGFAFPITAPVRRRSSHAPTVPATGRRPPAWLRTRNCSC